MRISDWSSDVCSSDLDDSDLPKLFALMNSTDDKEQAGQVQDAIISALGNAGDAKTQAAQTDILLNQMQKAGAGKKSRFLRILASVGGTKALQAVAGAFDKGDRKSTRLNSSH